MIAAGLSVFAILLLIIICEYLWRHKKLSSELSRKIIHISVGSFVAFWPLFMSWVYVELISLAFIAVIFISLKTKLFKSIHSVNRSTWGELSFAAVIAILAFVLHTKWIFAAAVLHLSLADGLAAVVGTHYARNLRYSVFKDRKSVAGTLTFLVVSFAIVAIVGVGWGGSSWMIVAWLPILATLTENLSIHGTDNFFVPLVVALGLRWF